MNARTFERWADAVLHCHDVAVAAHIMEACRFNRRALATVNAAERRFNTAQAGTHVLNAVSLALAERGLSTATQLRVAGMVAERLN